LLFKATFACAINLFLCKKPLLVQETFSCARKAKGHKGKRAQGAVLVLLFLFHTTNKNSLITMTMVAREICFCFSSLAVSFFFSFSF